MQYIFLSVVLAFFAVALRETRAALKPGECEGKKERISMLVHTFISLGHLEPNNFPSQFLAELRCVALR